MQQGMSNLFPPRLTLLRVRRRHRELHRRVIMDHHLGVPPKPSAPCPTAICQDPEEPRIEPFLLLVARKGAVHAHPGVLHRLLRVLLVVEHAAREAEAPRIVVPNELGERTEVALLRSRDDARVE